MKKKLQRQKGREETKQNKKRETETERERRKRKWDSGKNLHIAGCNDVSHMEKAAYEHIHTWHSEMHRNVSFGSCLHYESNWMQQWKSLWLSWLTPHLVNSEIVCNYYFDRLKIDVRPKEKKKINKITRSDRFGAAIEFSIKPNEFGVCLWDKRQTRKISMVLSHRDINHSHQLLSNSKRFLWVRRCCCVPFNITAFFSRALLVKWSRK